VASFFVADITGFAILAPEEMAPAPLSLFLNVLRIGVPGFRLNPPEIIQMLIFRLKQKSAF
jgi:hypothetical protein